MPQSYTPEFKKKIVRLHLEEGRTYKSITAEYGVSKASISKWCAELSEECQTKADINPNTLNEAELMSLKSVPMHIITTGNTGRRIIMPGKPNYGHRSRRFIILTMVSTVIGA